MLVKAFNVRVSLDGLLEGRSLKIREWTGLGSAKSQRTVESREKMEETGCEIICGAPTTLAVNG